MKIKQEIDLESFFKAIDQCQGSVILQGDDIWLNLKSVLARYFALSQVLAHEQISCRMQIKVSEPSDVLLLSDYLERI